MRSSAGGDADGIPEREPAGDPHAIVDRFVSDVYRAADEQRRTRLARIARAIGVRRGVAGGVVVGAAAMMWPWVPVLSIAVLAFGLLGVVTAITFAPYRTPPSSHHAEYGVDGTRLHGAAPSPIPTTPPMAPGGPGAMPGGG